MYSPGEKCFDEACTLSKFIEDHYKKLVPDCGPFATTQFPSTVLSNKVFTVQKPIQGKCEDFPGQEQKFIFVRHQLPGFIIRSEIVGEMIIRFSPIHFQTMSYIQKYLTMTDVTDKSNIM